MAEAKRFYWLKLKHEFFKKNIYVKKLRRMNNGTELAFLYLELLTYSLEDNGIITFQGVEENLGEELALNLDEDADLMCELIDFLLKYDLLVPQEDNNFLLVEVLESTGSETKQAEYNRIRRANERKGNLVTESGNNVTNEGNNVTNCYPNDKQCFLEKEKEKREREEIEREGDDPQPAEKVKNFIDYQKIVDLYHEKCPSLSRIKYLTPERKQRLKNLLSKYSIEQIEKAFEKAQSSAFLRGECNGSGHESWKADFDFIIKPKNFIRIIEGVYDARGQPIDSGISYADMEADLLENI